MLSLLQDDHISISISISTAISIYLYLSICLSVYLSIYLSLSIHIYIYIYILIHSNVSVCDFLYHTGSDSWIPSFFSFMCFHPIGWNGLTLNPPDELADWLVISNHVRFAGWFSEKNSRLSYFFSQRLGGDKVVVSCFTPRFYYHSRDFDVFLQTSLWIIVVPWGSGYGRLVDNPSLFLTQLMSAWYILLQHVTTTQ